jgi:hypothetical protein
MTPISAFLRGVDPNNQYGHLQRVLTPNGFVRWVCREHADKSLTNHKELGIQHILAEHFASRIEVIRFDRYELRLEISPSPFNQPACRLLLVELIYLC